MSGEMSAYPRPKLAYNRDNAFFGEGLAEGVFRIQRCASCRVLRNPPRPMCPECGSFEWDTVDASGRGRIYSYAVHHHPRPPGLKVPVPVVLVELDEGVRALGNLVQAGEEALRIDAPVELVIEADDGGALLTNWRPAS